MNEQALQIDPLTYLENKAQGRVKIIKLNGQPFYTQRRFNQATGEPEPVLIQLDAKALKDMLERTTKVAEALVNMIADVEDAKEAAL